MTQLRRALSPFCQAIKTSDGSIVLPDKDGWVSLGTSSYVFVLGGLADALVAGVHIASDATIAITTGYVETSNFPRTVSGSETVLFTDYSTTVGEWIKQDPSTAYVPTTGTGWSVTNMTFSKTAGTGGLWLDLGNIACHRARVFVTIGTAGTMRLATSAKD